MSTYAAAVSHVLAALNADTALVAAVGGRIFEGLAPDKAAYPLIVVQSYTDPTDTRTFDGRVLTVLDLTVRAFTSTPAGRVGSIAEVVPLARAIDTALDRTTSASVAACVRVGEMNQTRQETGSIIRSLGSRFRVTVTSLPV